MNYAGFLRPVWAWLRGDDLPEELRPLVLGRARRAAAPAGAAAVSRRCARSAPACRGSRVLHSWTLLDSHDTARFRTVAGSRERQLVGVGLQMTTPGVPMIFAGDELGLEGDWGEDGGARCRGTRPRRWDTTLLAEATRG